MPHQKAYQDDDLSKFLHLSGGFGSGKSHALIHKVFKLSFLNRHLSGGLVCPTFTDYKKDILPLLEEVLRSNNINYFHHKTEQWFRFPWTRGKLYVVSADKPIRGPNWAYAAINEVTLIPLDRYREVISRVRLKKARFPQIVSSGTPEGIASEYYEIFVEEPWPGSRVIYGNTRDNALNLNEDYIRALEASYDSVMLDAYLKGLFVNMNGKRFYYAYDSTKNEDTSIVEDLERHVHISLDFNVDHMAATAWHTDGWEAHAFDEVVIDRDATTKNMCRIWKQRGWTPDRVTVYPDPAGQSRSTKGQPDVTIIREEGFHDVKVKKQAPTFRARQLNMNNLLDKTRIKLNPLKCRSLRKDFVAVEQDKNTFEKIKTNPKLTHSSDGADYLGDILFPFSGDRPPRNQIIKIR